LHDAPAGPGCVWQRCAAASPVHVSGCVRGVGGWQAGVGEHSMMLPPPKGGHCGAAEELWALVLPLPAAMGNLLKHAAAFNEQQVAGWVACRCRLSRDCCLFAEGCTACTAAVMRAGLAAAAAAGRHVQLLHQQLSGPGGLLGGGSQPGQQEERGLQGGVVGGGAPGFGGLCGGCKCRLLWPVCLQLPVVETRDCGSSQRRQQPEAAAARGGSRQGGQVFSCCVALLCDFASRVAWVLCSPAPPPCPAAAAADIATAAAAAAAGSAL